MCVFFLYVTLYGREKSLCSHFCTLFERVGLAMAWRCVVLVGVCVPVS